MATSELQQFMTTWERETEGTLKLLRALPDEQYDFRPDPGGRSLGELAWHLAEIDAYSSTGIDQGEYSFARKPPNIERPKSLRDVASGYQKVHEDAVARLRKLTPADLERSVTFFDGSMRPIRELLWSALLMHSIHHRGQLALMCRLAGGCAPGLYGPNREETAAFRARMAAAAR